MALGLMLLAILLLVGCEPLDQQELSPYRSPIYEAQLPRQINLSWTNPTTFVDGTDIPPGGLASVNATCWPIGGNTFHSVHRHALDPGARETMTIDVIEPGLYGCVAWVYAFASIIPSDEAYVEITLE